MASQREILVRIVGDPAQLERAFSRAKYSASAFDKSMTGVGKNADRTFRGIVAGSGAFHGLGRSVAFASTAFLGGAGFTAAVKGAYDAAVGLKDAVDESNVVFGRSARQLQAWSKTTVNSMGMASRESIGFANAVGRMLKGLEVAPGKTADWSKRIVQLSADMGELRSRDPGEFIQAFSAALAGRTRGLKTWGIAIDEAAIKQQALKDGLIRTTKDALTPAARAQAIYELTLRKTADATGFFAKQHDDADNKMKRLHAAVGNIQEAIGEALLPTISDVADSLTDWLSKSENQEKVTRTLTGAIDTFSGAVRDAIPVIQEIIEGADKVAGALGGWKHTLELLLALKALSWLNNMKTGFAGVATSIGRANTKLQGEQGLLGGLGKLSKIGRIAVPIALATQFTDAKGSVLSQVVQNGLLGLMFGGPGGAGAAVAATLLIKLTTMDGLPGTPSQNAARAEGALYANSTTTLGLARRGPNAGKETVVFRNGQYGTYTTDPMNVRKITEQEAAALLGVTVQALSKKLQRAVASSAAAGGLTYPLLGNRGQIRGFPGQGTHSYTAGPNNWESDNAIDIYVKVGTPVVAVESGTIGDQIGPLESSDPKMAGLRLHLLGDSGNEYYYAHLSKIVVRRRQRVRKGEILGYSGSANGVAHLHFAQKAGTPTQFQGVASVRTSSPGAYGPALPAAQKSAPPAGPAKAPPARLVSTAVGVREGIGQVSAAQINRVAQLTGVSPQLIKAILEQESGGVQSRFGQVLTSRAGAKGVMQLMAPSTLAASAGQAGLWANLVQGTRQFAGYLHKYGSVELALIAYNWGPGNLDRYLKRHHGKLTLSDLPSETQSYVQSILGAGADRPMPDRTDDSALRRQARQRAQKAAQIYRQEIKRILDQVKSHPERVDMLSSMLATRAGDQIPGLRAAATKIQQQARRELRAAMQQASVADSQGRSLLDTLLGMDQSSTIQTQDKFGRAVTTTVGQVVARLRVLLGNLEEAMRSGNAKAVRAAIKAWDGYAPMLSAAVQAGTDAAAARLEAARSQFETSFGRLSGAIMDAFDRQTEQRLSAMAAAAQAEADSVQRAAAQQIQSLQQRADAQIQRLQERLQARIKKLQERLQKDIAKLELQRAAPTPAEAALAQMQAQHDAAQAARELAEARQALATAQRSGDPEQIRQAQDQLNEVIYQQTITGLQKQAEAERAARDKEIQAQEDALTKKEQQQEESLQKQEQAEEESIRKRLEAQTEAIQAEAEARVAAIQAEEAAREQEYRDQRALERQNLEDQLAAWAANLASGKATWGEFAAWLAKQDPAMAAAGGRLGAAFARAYLQYLERAYQAQQALASGQNPGNVNIPSPSQLIGHGDSGGRRGGFAAGGKIPGGYTGVPDGVAALVTPGEYVIDRRLTRALEEIYVNGAAGGDQPVYNLRGVSAPTAAQAPVVLDFRGSLMLDRAPHVARQIARVLEPHLGKTIQIKT